MSTRDVLPAVEPGHRASGAGIVRIAVFVLGLGLALVRLIPQAAGISPLLVLAVVLAMHGWRTLPPNRVVRWYLACITAFAVWCGLSTVFAWDFGTTYKAASMLIWPVVIVPGIGSLCRDRGVRESLMLGVVVGSGLFSLVAFVRLLGGRSVLDAPLPGGGQLVLGVDRNGLNLMAVMVIGWLLVRPSTAGLRAVRLPALALSVIWVLVSGGRSGLAGLALVALVWAVLQPTMGRRVRVLLAAAIAASALWLAVPNVRERTTGAVERFARLRSGQYNDSDEIRRLVLRKAWLLSLEHPVLGVGFDRFRSTEHDVYLEARTRRALTIAPRYIVHNTYAEMLVSFGFPGAVAFIAALATLLVGTLRSRTPVTRASAAALAGTYEGIFFITVLGGWLWLALAVTIGVIVEHDQDR